MVEDNRNFMNEGSDSVNAYMNDPVLSHEFMEGQEILDAEHRKIALEHERMADQINKKNKKRSRKQRSFAFLAGFISAVLIVLLLSYFIQTPVSINGWTLVANEKYKHMEYMSEKYGELEELYKYVKEKYYKHADDSVIMESLYKGLLGGIGDKYSDYFTQQEYEDALSSSSSEFEGIGIVFSGTPEGGIVIVEVMRDSPAEDAGLKAGDKILTIDGTAYSAADVNNAGRAIRGKKGTTVRLTVNRDGKNISFNIIRARIDKESVVSRVADDLGIIEISSFETKTGEQFRKELRNMEVKGVKGLIIDLRGNGGGVVESAVEIADSLMKEGIIVAFKDNSGKKTYRKSDAKSTKLQLVLLIDGTTASASEILAAAVKDSGAGTLVGERTYGKGVVQVIAKMKSGGAVKLTTMEFFSPKGKKIDGVGVMPDVQVHLDASGVDMQLATAIKILKK